MINFLLKEKMDVAKKTSIKIVQVSSSESGTELTFNKCSNTNNNTTALYKNRNNMDGKKKVKVKKKRIVEKGLSVKHKKKVENFLGVASDNTIEKLDDPIKDKPDNTMMYIGTNDLSNNIKLLQKKN